MQAEKHALFSSSSITVPYLVFMFSAILILNLSVKPVFSDLIKTSAPSTYFVHNLTKSFFFVLFTCKLYFLGGEDQMFIIINY